MNETVNDSVIEKIRKLIAHADSARAIGSLAEAEAFGAKVSELLAKHKLEMSDVEFAAVKETDPIARQYVHPREGGYRKVAVRQWWRESLGSTIARAHFCRILVYEKHNGLTFVGRGADRAVAVHLFIVLGRALERLVEREWRKAQKSHREWQDALFPEDRAEIGRVWKTSFLDGAVAGIGDRLRKAREDMTVGLSSTALVKLDDKEVDEYLGTLKASKAKSVRLPLLDVAAYRAGQRAAQDIALQSAVAAAPGGPVPALAGR